MYAITFLMLFLPTLALAQDSLNIFPGVLDTSAQPKAGPCAKLNLSKDQKEKLKIAYFKAQTIQLEGENELKKTGLEYARAFNDSKSNLSSVQPISKNVINAHSKVIASSIAYHDEVYFSILKPEQRELGQECETHQESEEMWKYHPGMKGE